jgi:hypothetical protein
VEAYFPGYGWITFDPTPPAGTMLLAGGFSQFSKWLDAARTFWTDWVVSYDFSRQFLVIQQMNRSTRETSVQTQNYFRRRYLAIRDRLAGWHQQVRENPLVIPAAILLVAAGMLLFMLRERIVYLWRQVLSRRRVRSGRVTAGDVTLAYHRLLALLARRGVPRTPAMTPRQLAAAVHDPVLAPLVWRFTEVYEEARFGGVTGRLPELYQLLAECVKPPMHAGQRR